MLVQRAIFGYFAICSVVADIMRQIPTGAVKNAEIKRFHVRSVPG
jgi:hypothetical protein